MSELEQTGPFLGLARAIESGTLAMQEAQQLMLTRRGDITYAHVKAADRFVQGMLVQQRRGDLEIAYAVGELALIWADAHLHSDLSLRLAMNVAALISGMRKPSLSLRRRRLELRLLALEKSDKSQGMELALLLYNLGNAQRDVGSGDPAAAGLDAIAYYEASLLHLPLDAPGNVRSSVLHNIGSRYLELPCGNRFSNLLVALDHYRQAKDATDERRDPQGTLSSLYGMLHANEGAKALEEKARNSAFYQEVVRVLVVLHR